MIDSIRSTYETYAKIATLKYARTIQKLNAVTFYTIYTYGSNYAADVVVV